MQRNGEQTILVKGRIDGMKTRLMVVGVLLSALGVSSWAAQGEVAINALGPGETVEHVWLLTAPPPTDVETEAVCEGVEFDVTFSDASGYVAPVTEHVILSLSEPLAKASASFAGFGKFVLTRRSNEEKRGACEIRRRTRIVGYDGRTAAETGEYVGFTLSAPGEDEVHDLPWSPHGLIMSVGDESETMEHVFFSKYSGTEIKRESACVGVEFDVTISEPTGLVAHEISHVSLTPDAPLYEVNARFADFGEVILSETSNVSVQGDCEVLTETRTTDADGRTADVRKTGRSRGFGFVEMEGN
jgi:hypothetical protein